MKALTVQQPWAWSIIHGGKLIENRTQAWTHRGLLAIHAGGRWSERGGESDLVAKAWAIERRIKPEWGDKCYPMPRQDLFPTGAIIGVVDLVDVHQALPEGEPDYPGQPTNAACCESPWAEQSYVEHGGKTRNQLVHLVLENPLPLQHPIPAKGRLGIWTLDVETELRIGASFWADEIRERGSRDA